MNWIDRQFAKHVLRSFQREIQSLPKEIDKNQEILMLSGIFQNQAFIKYINSRNTAMLMAMGNEGQKPSDEQYLEAYYRRLELLNLYLTAKLAYNKRNTGKNAPPV